jgi:hypothetical protein
MIKFEEVDRLLNIDSNKELKNLIYIDTDSLFLTLPVEIETDRERAEEYVNTLQTEINDNYLLKFLHMHNIKIREKEENPLLRVDFKNEYLIKSMILYAKKRYISVIIKYKKDGSPYYDVDLKGVEGKRVTNNFVKIIVNDLIEYIKNIKTDTTVYSRFDILYNIIKKYISDFYKVDSDNIYDILAHFSLPVNVNKKIEKLKNVAGYYKGTIIYDSVTKENYWKDRTGKGKWLCVKLKDESYIPDILKRFGEYDQIKTEGKKIKDIIKDITIPDEALQKESDSVRALFDIFEINYDYYTELLMKKITLMYNPFDPEFCNNLSKKQNNNLPNNYSIMSEGEIYEYSIVGDSR